MAIRGSHFLAVAQSVPKSVRLVSINAQVVKCRHTTILCQVREETKQNLGGILDPAAPKQINPDPLTLCVP